MYRYGTLVTQDFTNYYIRHKLVRVIGEKGTEILSNFINYSHVLGKDELKYIKEIIAGKIETSIYVPQNVQEFEIISDNDIKIKWYKKILNAAKFNISI